MAALPRAETHAQLLEVKTILHPRAVPIHVPSQTHITCFHHHHLAPLSGHFSPSATGMMDMSSSSSAPIPVIKVPRQRIHPNCSGRKVLVDGRDNYACILDIVQAAAGIFETGLRAYFKRVDCTVIQGAQVGGSVCSLCISFRVLRLEQLCISALWLNAKILFGKKNMVCPLRSCLQSSLEQCMQE